MTKLADVRAAVGEQVRHVVVGQEAVLDDVLAAVAVGGHVLLEGPPGVAKTLLASAVARSLGLGFARIQLTPDMLPSDITGNVVLRAGKLTFHEGPIFTNLLLADEINRTPPKTQAALLEAMQERQVTVEGESHPLPDPFVVLATQNPIEHEGTYPLPEAQLDRFIAKVIVGYPDADDEVAALRTAHRGVVPTGLDDVRVAVAARELDAMRDEVDATIVDDKIFEYVAAVVRATRALPSVALGASPRAGVHLLAASRAAASLAGRAYVTPDDVIRMTAPVLRHRLVLRPEADLERFRPDDAIAAAVAAVPVPR